MEYWKNKAWVQISIQEFIKLPSKKAQDIFMKQFGLKFVHSFCLDLQY